MRHILDKSQCDIYVKYLQNTSRVCWSLQTISESIAKLGCHHHDDPRFRICGAIHILEEISWDMTAEVSNKAVNVHTNLKNLFVNECITMHNGRHLQCLMPNESKWCQDSVCLMPFLGKTACQKLRRKANTIVTPVSSWLFISGNFLCTSARNLGRDMKPDEAREPIACSDHLPRGLIDLPWPEHDRHLQDSMKG